jgi:hypothetical protein
MRLLAVNYHYYRTERPSSGIYPISPVSFATQISNIAANWTIANECQVLEAIDGDSSTDVSLCLITFDDGLKEQMRAVHWLRTQGFAAVCYIPTAPLTESCVLDVHKLHMIRASRPDVELVTDLTARFGVAFTGIDPDAASAQYPLDDADAQRLKYFLNFVLDLRSRRDWVDRQFEQLVGNEAAVASALYMDRADVCFLAKHGMIGTHSHSHLALAMLDNAAISLEIGKSLDVIQDITGVRVRGISYPYGGPTAVDENVGRVAEEFGLSYGLSMRSGVNGPSVRRNRMLLKRVDTNDVSAVAGLPNRLQ